MWCICVYLCAYTVYACVRLCVNEYVFTCVVCTCGVYACVHVCVQLCTRVYMCAYSYVRMRAYVCVCMKTCVLCLYVVHTCILLCICSALFTDLRDLKIALRVLTIV